MLKYNNRYRSEFMIKNPTAVYINKNRLIGLVILKNFNEKYAINIAKTNSKICMGRAIFLRLLRLTNSDWATTEFIKTRKINTKINLIIIFIFNLAKF